MKKILMLGVIASLSFSCAKDALETFPSNAVKPDVVYGDVKNATSALTGALAGLGAWAWTNGVSSGVGFGITSSYLTADALGEDYILSGAGSGWMWQTFSYNVKNWYDDSRLQCYTEWNCYYTTINSCNSLIASAELLSATNEGKFVLGQAYTLRAFCYHMLAQFYARAYYYYPEDLCVPVYTEPTTSATKGAPRSTNKQVYEEVIYPDLTTGIGLLDEANKADIKRSNKTQVDYYVANGIKARVALAMHKWEDAYTAAEEALKGPNQPLDISQLKSGMNDITALSNVMWGEIKTPDNYGMYASYQSQMDADHDGYAQKARRCCTSWLWNRMGAEDGRRAWWLGNFDNTQYQATGQAIKYCQVKFKFQGNTWLGDYIYMRAEEMLLTAAEAYCHAGNDTEAKNYLTKLMALRDPAYKCELSGKTYDEGGLTLGSAGGKQTPQSLLEEILVQRRIELWGEFGRIFDIKRLGQGFKRVETNAADNPDFDPASLLNKHDTQSPGSYAWVLMLPQVEIDGNPNAVQNPIGDTAN